MPSFTTISKRHNIEIFEGRELDIFLTTDFLGPRAASERRKSTLQTSNKSLTDQLRSGGEGEKEKETVYERN
jgi:hypothetical protein